MPIPQAQLSPYLRVTEGWPRSHTDSLSKHYVPTWEKSAWTLHNSQDTAFGVVVQLSPTAWAFHHSSLKLMGDWSSDAYMAYIDHTTPTDLARLPRALAMAIAAMA